MLEIINVLPNRHLLVRVQKFKFARTMHKTYAKLTIKTPERLQWHILVSLLLTLNRFHTLLWSSTVNFEQVIASRKLM